MDRINHRTGPALDSDGSASAWTRMGPVGEGKLQLFKVGRAGFRALGGARKCHGWMPTAAFRLQHGGLGAILARPINERHFGRVLN